MEKDHLIGMKISQGYILKNSNKSQVLENMERMKKLLQKHKEEIVLKHIAQNLTYYHDLKNIAFISPENEKLKLQYWKDYWIQQTTQNLDSSYKYDLAFVAQIYFQPKYTLIRIETGNYNLLEQWNIFSKTETCNFDSKNSQEQVSSLEQKRQSKKWEKIEIKNPDLKILLTDGHVQKEIEGQWENYIPTYSERKFFLTEQLLVNYWESKVKEKHHNIYDFKIWSKSDEAKLHLGQITEDLALLLPLNIDFTSAKN